jgi:hypothetical protein
MLARSVHRAIASGAGAANSAACRRVGKPGPDDLELAQELIMTSHDDDRFDAMALLERANPIGPDDEPDAAQLAAAHAHVRALLDSQRPTSDGLGSPAPSRDTAQRRPGRRLGLGVAALAATAVAAVLLLTSSTAGPGVPSATAMTIERAAQALQAPPGTILHIDSTLTEAYSDGHSYSTRQDVWQQQNAVPAGTQAAAGCNWLNLRRSAPGTHAGTEGGTVNGRDELYDPVRNTIYVAPPVKLPPLSRGVPLPNECSYMADFAQQVRGLLTSGRARVAGHATIDGTDTIKIVFAGGANTYYVAADTYAPVELINGRLTGPGGLTTTVFHAYQRLPAAGHGYLLSLKARHPTARVETSLAGYRKAINRLFPNG